MSKEHRDAKGERAYLETLRTEARRILFEPNHYARLNLPISASPKDVQHRYNDLALRFHPDHHAQRDIEDAAFFNQVTVALNESYDVLKNQDLRDAYNNELSLLFSQWFENWIRYGLPGYLHKKNKAGVSLQEIFSHMYVVFEEKIRFFIPLEQRSIYQTTFDKILADFAQQHPAALVPIAQKPIKKPVRKIKVTKNINLLRAAFSREKESREHACLLACHNAFYVYNEAVRAQPFLSRALQLVGFLNEDVGYQVEDFGSLDVVRAFVAKERAKKNHTLRKLALLKALEEALVKWDV